MTLAIVQNNRYKVHRLGLFRWGVRAGDGQRVLGTRMTQYGAMRLAAELQTAYFDGVYTNLTIKELRECLGMPTRQIAPDNA